MFEADLKNISKFVLISMTKSDMYSTLRQFVMIFIPDFRDLGVLNILSPKGVSLTYLCREQNKNKKKNPKNKKNGGRGKHSSW